MITLIQGDCRLVLPTLPDELVDCIVTSPPYWGLRDYGLEGQIGLEPELEGYVDSISCVARELWRLLRPSGCFFLNLGDCYSANHASGRRGANGQGANRSFTPEKLPAHGRLSGLKPKDLCLVPFHVAVRLRAEGWWVRSEIVWAKPNAVPESVRDRPTSSHEEQRDRIQADAGLFSTIVEYDMTGERP